MKRARQRQLIVTLYLLIVASVLLVDQLWSSGSAPAEADIDPAPIIGLGLADNALIFISDTDSIDAGRQSNSVYRIGLDGRGLKRVVGSIPHDAGYLLTTDIDCHPASQQLVIASHRRDINGFHHALLDGTGLHLDKPATGDLLSATRQIAIAPDGQGIVVSRQFEVFEEPRFGLVAGDLYARHFDIFRAPTAERSYISPDFSPTGRQLVYIIKRHDAADSWATRLVIAIPAGRREWVLHETRGQMSDVAWSPTGEWLALVADGQIYRIHGTGGELTRLTDHLGGATSPRWSPDGERISYVTASTFPGLQQIMIMKADGTDKRQVTSIRGAVTNGCWV